MNKCICWLLPSYFKTLTPSKHLNDPKRSQKQKKVKVRDEDFYFFYKNEWDGEFNTVKCFHTKCTAKWSKYDLNHLLRINIYCSYIVWRIVGT